MSETQAIKQANPIGQRLRAEMQRQYLRRVVSPQPTQRPPLFRRVVWELGTLGGLTIGTRLRLWVARCVGAL